jgi:hypothetical protein
MKALPRAFLVVMALAVASEACAYALRGSVVGTGATPVSGTGNGTQRVVGTAGQPVVGKSAGASHVRSHGFWSPGGPRVIAVPDPPAALALPQAVELELSSSHPVRGDVRLRLALPAPADVRLAVYDLQGRLVTVLARGLMPAGWHAVRWRQARGAAGVYFARLLLDGQPVAARTIVIVAG